MIELVSGLIGVAIGSLITYFASKKLLQLQIEKQQAYDFISTHYLPLEFLWSYGFIYK